MHHNLDELDIALTFYFVFVTAQPIGQPEICKISCRESPVEGGGEIFIIGKNFMKGTKVYFQEREDDDEEGEIMWQKEADIDKDYFQQVCPRPHNDYGSYYLSRKFHKISNGLQVCF